MEHLKLIHLPKNIAILIQVHLEFRIYIGPYLLKLKGPAVFILSKMLEHSCFLLTCCRPNCVLNTYLVHVFVAIFVKQGSYWR